MTSRGGSDDSLPWSDWVWNEQRQKLQRTLKDRKGKVIRTQYGQRSQDTIPPPSAKPRYPGAGGSLPPQPDREPGGATTENYAYGAPETAGAPQEGIEHRDQMTTPTPYGFHRQYAAQGAGVPSGYQASYVPSTALAAESGLRAAPPQQNAPPMVQRYSATMGQTMQPSYEDHYGNPAGQSFNSPLQYGASYSGQPVPSQFGSQNPIPGAQMGYAYPSAVSKGSAWPSGYQNISGYGPADLSPSGAWQHRGPTGQTAQPRPTEQRSAPAGGLAPSGFGANAASALDQGEVLPSSKAGRRQSINPGSYAPTMDSGLQSEKETLVPHCLDSSGDTMEIASSKSADYRRKEPLPDSKGASKPSSRVPPPGFERPPSYDDDPVGEMTQAMAASSIRSKSQRRRSAEPPTSPRQEGQKARSRIPPPGLESLGSYDEVSMRSGARDMTSPSQSPYAYERPTAQRQDSRDYQQGYYQNQQVNQGWEKPSFSPYNSLPPEQQEKEEQSKPIVRGPGNKEPKKKNDSLHNSFRVHDSPLFRKGRVFLVLWSEPLGEKTNPGSTYEGEMGSIEESKYGESAYNSVRRFVIVKVRKGHCMCVPILTYGGRGTAKQGVKANDHAIIYTGREAPKELSGERKLHKKPVRVHNNSEKDKLDVASRVNYSKVYTVEHNVKVCFIGEIHKDSKGIFLTDFKRTFEDDSDAEEVRPSGDRY